MSIHHFFHLLLPGLVWKCAVLRGRRCAKKGLLLVAWILASCVPGQSEGIDIPLSIQETAGVERFQYPIISGVPIPQGALRSTEKLQILDAHGRFIPAQFSVANRWWRDGSIQWVHFDFSANIPANGKVTYFLREVEQIPEFPSPIGFIPRGRNFEVISGPLRFVIGGESNQLLDQVWVDENWGYDFSDHTKILESGNFDLVFNSGNRTFRTCHWTQNRIEVEETNALRAVIKVSGSFALVEQKEKSLDYVARITVYGGKTYIKIAFTLINRQSSSATNSVRLDDLSFHVKLNLVRDQQKFVFGGASDNHQGRFTEKTFASLYQESSDRYLLSGALEGTGPGKSLKPLNLGWADLSDEQHGLAISTKWFWQLYPKAYEVKNDGTITLRLFPKQAPPQYIDPGVAKTHELLFYFHGKRDFATGQVKNVLLGFQKPVYALASPRWYCQDTKALGRLAESSEATYRSEYWSLVQKYDQWLTHSRDAIVNHRDQSYRLANQEIDEYGMLHFGDAIHWASQEGKERLEGAGWENLNYDFPHALYLHFFRTGDLRSLEVAEEGLAHLKDARTFPSAADPNYPYESLFDSFLLTGNRGALDAARVSVEQSFNHLGLDIAQNPRSFGNRLLGLLKGYEVFGEPRFLDGADHLVNAVHAWQDGNVEVLKQLAPGMSQAWKEKYRDGYGEPWWAYGPTWEGLLHSFQLTGKKEIPLYLQRSVDWIHRNPQEWAPDERRYLDHPELATTLALGLAATYEFTGNQKYWDLAMEAFHSLVGLGTTMDRLDLFAQCFGTSQRFLWYLSKDFPGPQKREVSLLESP